MPLYPTSDYGNVISRGSRHCAVLFITSMLRSISQLTVQYSGDGCRIVGPGAAAGAGCAMFLLHSRLHPVLLLAHAGKAWTLHPAYVK